MNSIANIDGFQFPTFCLFFTKHILENKIF